MIIYNDILQIFVKLNTEVSTYLQHLLQYHNTSNNIFTAPISK